MGHNIVHAEPSQGCRAVYGNVMQVRGFTNEGLHGIGAPWERTCEAMPQLSHSEEGDTPIFKSLAEARTQLMEGPHRQGGGCTALRQGSINLDDCTM
jgi:hypothetical protein